MTVRLFFVRMCVGRRVLAITDLTPDLRRRARLMEREQYQRRRPLDLLL